MRNSSIAAAAGLVAVLVTSAAFFSCDHVNGVGEVVKKPLHVETFRGIVVKGSMDVVITRSDERAVVIEAPSNIADLVTTTVRKGIWYIRTSKSYSTTKPFTVHIAAPEMDMVRMEGSGSVKSVGPFEEEDVSLAIDGSGDITMAFRATSIMASVAGSGDLELSGACEHLNAVIAGSGTIMATDLAVKDLDVDIAGSGEVNAAASGAVDVRIAGSGDVVLAGAPAKMNKRITGSGSVRIAQ